MLSFSLPYLTLPAANPLALITTSFAPPNFSMNSKACGICEALKLWYWAVGMLYLAIKSLEKDLLPSICAAYGEGPKTGMPAASEERGGVSS